MNNIVIFLPLDKHKTLLASNEYSFHYDRWCRRRRRRCRRRRHLLAIFKGISFLFFSSACNSRLEDEKELKYEMETAMNKVLCLSEWMRCIWGGVDVYTLMAMHIQRDRIKIAEAKWNCMSRKIMLESVTSPRHTHTHIATFSLRTAQKVWQKFHQ